MAALASNALTSLANIKQYLGRGGIKDTDDELIKNLIGRVSTLFETYCDRKLTSQEHTEYYNGTGDDVLFPKNYPITTVSGLWSDSDRNWTIGTNDFAASEYCVQEDRWIQLYDSTFSYDINNVKIIYTAGYSTIPADLEQACIEQVVWKYKEGTLAQLLNVGAKNRGEDQATYGTDALLSQVTAVLDRYKKRSV